MSSDGGDDPQSPSAFLDAPSSQSLIVDAKPFVTRPKPTKTDPNENDQYSSEEERENRFAGPASTWRDYTADERGLVASLDRERASNLSIHLFNAHALKSRLYDRQRAAESQPWQNKYQWIKPEEDGSIPWHPDTNWTAWPLHADEVPRKSEGFGKDALVDDTADGTFKMPVPWRAGADLNEEVLALMLRRAKSRFNSRSEAHVDLPSRQQSRTRSPSQLRSSPPVAEESRQSSVASETRSHESDSETERTETEEYPKPGFMADDDRAKHLLGQSSRHVLAEFDRLLMGLHRSRQYHTSGPAADNSLITKSRSHKRKRRSTTTETPAPLAQHANFGVEDDQEHDMHRDYTKHPSGGHNAIPRDWSEVLGVASLAGWHPAVVERAAKRCAALFGERMLFRRMPETAVGKAADKLTEYLPEMVPEFEIPEDSQEQEVEVEEGPVHSSEDGFKCPEESCPQHNRFYEKRFMIRQHLRRVHQYDQKALDTYDRACAPQDAKPSVEQADVQGTRNKVEGSTHAQQSEEHDLTAAVATDGFLKPVEVQLVRGTDTKDRKKRGEAR